MIRFIAAIDSKRGLANDKGIPWDLPTDRQYFRDQTANSTVLMGYNTYLEFKKPWTTRRSLVATTSHKQLRPGFEVVPDAVEFLEKAKGDIWVMGGARLFASTIDLADELYLTHIDGDFHCTKFFPPYEDKFELVKKSPPQSENNTSFYYTVYRRRI